MHRLQLFDPQAGRLVAPYLFTRTFSQTAKELEVKPLGIPSVCGYRGDSPEPRETRSLSYLNVAPPSAMAQRTQLTGHVTELRLCMIRAR